VLIGEATERIADAIGDAVPVHRAKTLDDAVRESARLAKRGDAVLLSPACSSYDMFRDYKHRGDEFVRAVRVMGGAASMFPPAGGRR
jgi:UDP-N-acetylmuramoylalanine--D-glutamate ligase